MSHETHPAIRQLCKQAKLIDGQPWFLARDIGAMLGYFNGSKTVAAIHERHIEEFREAEFKFFSSSPDQQRRHGRAFSLAGLLKIAAHAKTDTAPILRDWCAQLICTDDALVHVLTIRGESS